MRHLSILVVLASVVGACGSIPGTDDFTESLREARPELTQADAECIVGELQQTYSDDELASLIDGTGNSEGDQRRFGDTQLAAVRACDLEAQVSAELVKEFGRANDLFPEVAECAVASLQKRFGFWELTDLLSSDELEVRFQRRQFEAIFACGDRSNVVQQLGPQMVEQGVDPDDASCVAEVIADTMDVEDLGVLYSGEMTDRFYSLYFAALETCDALPADS